MNATLPEPLWSHHMDWALLYPRMQTAVLHQADESGFSGNYVSDKLHLLRFRVEGYKTADIAIGLFQDRWGWPDLPKMMMSEVRRVHTIIQLIKGGAPVWPYYSYWARNMTELWGDDNADPSDRDLDHGAGWHRIIAQHIMGYETVELLFDIFESTPEDL